MKKPTKVPVRHSARVDAAEPATTARGQVEAIDQAALLGDLRTLVQSARQRIAVARAFFKDAPILLLDEPTSALDSQVEEELHRSIKNLAEGRTTIIIAHRLSTVLQADKIYVISDGKAVESGTHAQLLLRKGHYARLFHTQLFGPEDAARVASGTSG